MQSIDVIIFGGQSNMQGQAETLSDTAFVENAFEYKQMTNTAVPLKNPVGENILYSGKEGYGITAETKLNVWLGDHALGASCYGNTNLVPYFCRAYINGSSRRVLAVHAAKGSTTVSEWLEGTNGYTALVKKSRSALSFIGDQYTVRKIFFVWLQGESDAVEAKSKSYYKEKLEELNASLKRDIGIDRFCIIRVGRFTNDKRDDEIIKAQDEICIENGDFLMLTGEATELNKNPIYMNPFVGGHYSARGLERLGALSGTTLREKEEL